MNDIVHVPFHGGPILAVEVDGKPRVLLKPIIERLGLTFPTQLRKLEGRSWACVTQGAMQVPGDTQRRTHTLVDLRTLTMLLATINENTVLPSTKPLLVKYQSEVADVIAAHFTKPDPANEIQPLSGLEYALRLVDAERRAEAGQKFKRAIEAGDGITLRSFHKKYFSAVAERDFFEHLYARRYLIDQRGKGAKREDGSFRDGSQHRHPGFQGKPWLYLHSTIDRTGGRRENARVRPGDTELEFRDLLAKQGLKANENTTGLFAIEGGQA